MHDDLEPTTDGHRVLHSLRYTWRWLRWRLAVFLLVVSAGLIAFAAGVSPSERLVNGGGGVATRLYYTLGLFVFGGLDIGVPSGGPGWARALLWCVYFGAPVITASAIVEGVLLAVRPHTWRLLRTRRHVVVGGCGRLAMLFLSRLRANDPKQPVVVVDNRADNPVAQAAWERYHAYVVLGDLSSPEVLASLRLDRADRLVLLTGDDHVNLDAASRIGQLQPRLAERTVVHVSDIRLLRVIEQRGLLPRTVKFNSYRMAARHVVRERLLPHFEMTECADSVVLAGFGRYGQTVLHELQTRARGRFDRVIIVDVEADRRKMVFADQVGFADAIEVEVLTEDVRHPRVWSAIADSVKSDPHLPTFVLATGDDGLNIRTSLWLSSRWQGAKILARCFEASSFTEQISRECSFEIVSTSDLLLASLDSTLGLAARHGAGAECRPHGAWSPG